jgi:23S rRNA (cytosine1962-C5)-methyltransferase
MHRDASDYELLDFGEAARLERWGNVVLARPDTRAAGVRIRDQPSWERADAIFEGRIGGGQWRPRPGWTPPADGWTILHAGHRFRVGCAPSGHTGLFPEQAAHWAWMSESLQRTGRDSTDPPEVLNLFAYTGGASVALAKAGAGVTHVDASRPSIGWARENAALNGVSTIRWIHEDARRFVDRERRRGRRYDALLLDPPAFGRGPAGDWQLDRDLGELLEAAVALLRPDPAFVLVNVYSGSPTSDDLERLLAWAIDAGSDLGGLGSIEADTLTLTTVDGRHLPTGIFARVRPATSRRPIDHG